MKRSRTDLRSLPKKKKVKEQEGLPKIIMKLGGEPKVSNGFKASKTKGDNVKEFRQGKKEKKNKFWLLNWL